MPKKQKITIPEKLYLQILDEHGVPLEPDARTHCETRVNPSDAEFRSVPPPSLFQPRPIQGGRQVFIAFDGFLKPKQKGNPSKLQVEFFINEVLNLGNQLGLEFETANFAQVYLDDAGNTVFLVGSEAVVE